jgi:hypothetical protein
MSIQKEKVDQAAGTCMISATWEEVQLDVLVDGISETLLCSRRSAARHFKWDPVLEWRHLLPNRHCGIILGGEHLLQSSCTFVWVQN